MIKILATDNIDSVSYAVKCSRCDCGNIELTFASIPWYTIKVEGSCWNCGHTEEILVIGEEEREEEV